MPAQFVEITATDGRRHLLNIEKIMYADTKDGGDIVIKLENEPGLLFVSADWRTFVRAVTRASK